MHKACASTMPATTLLSLPDELIELIFNEYYLGWKQAHGKKPRASSFQICKRISTLVESLWFRTISFHALRTTTEKFLAKLIRLDPGKRAAVRDLEICVRRDSTLLIYAALADLPNLHSLCLRLVGDNLQDYNGRPMGSADSRSGLQDVLEHCVNLRRLRLTSQSLPLGSCRLPATINEIALDARSLDASTADNLQQAGITRLELHFHGEAAATDFAHLPWASLQTLVVIFRSNRDPVFTCLERLVQKSLNGMKATKLQELEIKVMEDSRHLTGSIMDLLRGAFQQSPLAHLALYFDDATGLDLQLDSEWSTLKHLNLHITDYDFSSGCGELVSLTLRDCNFAIHEYDYLGIEELMKVDEKDWARQGRNLIAVVYLVRHRTKIRDLRIQPEDGYRELRWTRANATDDFALERWTLF